MDDVIRALLTILAIALYFVGAGVVVAMVASVLDMLWP